MKVGWLQDRAAYVGGAELTCREFRSAAPDDIEIVNCPAGETWLACDRYVVQNAVQYTAKDLEALADKQVVKYWHDIGPHMQPGTRERLAHAVNVCCSPIQAEHMGFSDAICIPPPVDLGRFEQAAQRVNGNRKGAVSVGAWRNYGKAPHRVMEWAAGNGGVDFYGGGMFAPAGSQEVPYEEMPLLLAQYKTFVFLPVVLEPFGRLVAEAWAAGLELVVNGLVGARWWIENAPDGLETAAEDFWRLVLSDD